MQHLNDKPEARPDMKLQQFVYFVSVIYFTALDVQPLCCKIGNIQWMSSDLLMEPNKFGT